MEVMEIGTKPRRSGVLIMPCQININDKQTDSSPWNAKLDTMPHLYFSSSFFISKTTDLLLIRIYNPPHLVDHSELANCLRFRDSSVLND